MIQVDRDITQDFERALGLEWLETNGLGGGAGTTVAGAHSRRRHGLLVAATEPAGRRMVLLSRLDETLHVEGESFELGCNQFPGAVAPRGYEFLASYHKDLFPVFEFEAGGVKLRKTVAALDGENTTLVLYEVLEAPAPLVLSLRPFLAARDLHELTVANSEIRQDVSFEEGVLSLRPYPEVPEVFLQVPGAQLSSMPQWWYRFEYEQDRRGGIDYQEDLWTPGVFGRELAAGDRLGVILSTQDPRGRDAFALFEKERKRREKMIKSLPVQDDVARKLALCLDASVLRQGPSREALVALPGLCLATGRADEAKKILRACAKAPGSAEASLWLFVAAWKYLQATEDEAFVRQTLLPALRKVAQAVERGKLELPEGTAATALWYNALATLAELEIRVGDPEESRRLEQQAKGLQKSFQVGDDDRPAEQILALSLPFPVLPKTKSAAVLARLEGSFLEGNWTPGTGAFLTALVKVQGTAGKKKARALAEALVARLPEAEVEAWEVADVLRAHVEDVATQAPKAKEAPEAPKKPAAPKPRKSPRPKS